MPHKCARVHWIPAFAGMTTLTVFAGMTILILTGCAVVPHNPNAWRRHWGVVFDGFNRNPEDRGRFAIDADQCQQLSMANDPAGAAIAGAIVGALIGAAVFRAGGLSGNRGAAFGAVPGTLEGAAAGAQDARAIFRNCMGTRGWSPLN